MIANQKPAESGPFQTFKDLFVDLRPFQPENMFSRMTVAVFVGMQKESLEIEPVLHVFNITKQSFFIFT